MICRKCEKHVLQAAELKKLCEISERHFKENAKDEYYFIHEHLREVKAASKRVGSEEASSSLIPPQLPIVPQKTPITTKTTENSSRLPKVKKLHLKTRRSSLRISQLKTFPPKTDISSKSVQLVEEPATKRYKTASKPDPVVALQIKSEESVDDDCNSTADTEVSTNDCNNLNELAFIDSLTFDQIKELTEVLAGILKPENEKSKKKKKKKDKKRFVQKLAPTRLRIRMKLKTKVKG